MAGHIVFVRFFVGYTSALPYDRLLGLRDEDISGAVEILRQEWWQVDANRTRFEQWQNEEERRRIECDLLLTGMRPAGFPIPVLPQNAQALSVLPSPSRNVRVPIPSFLRIASCAGWRNLVTEAFPPHCISPRYPVVSLGGKELADDAVAALNGRVCELATGADTIHGRNDFEVRLKFANPRFVALSEDGINRAERVTIREQIQRLRSPISGTPTLQERYIREYWPSISPTLEMISTLAFPASVTIPDWIRIHFRQKQFLLLDALWGKCDMSSNALAEILDYKNPITALENLHRRCTETNKGLAEKVPIIGEQWEIAERTRNDILYFFLRRIDTPGRNRDGIVP